MEQDEVKVSANPIDDMLARMAWGSNEDPKAEVTPNVEVAQESVTNVDPQINEVQAKSTKPIEDLDEGNNDWLKEEGDALTVTTTNNGTDLYEQISNVFSEYGDEVKSEEVVTKVSELRKSYKEATDKLAEMEANSLYANPEIAKANELAKMGGDYMEYLGLSKNNWDAVSDVDLITEVKLRSVFGDDNEKIDRFLDSMTDEQLKYEGTQLRNILKKEDADRKEAIFNQAKAQRDSFNNGVKTFLDSQKTLYGLKVTPSMSKEVFEGVSQKDAIREMFYDKSGNVSPEKMARGYFVLKNLNKIVNTAIANATSKRTEELLNEVTNPDVSRKGEKLNVQPDELSPLEREMRHLMGR